LRSAFPKAAVGIHLPAVVYVANVSSIWEPAADPHKTALNSVYQPCFDTWHFSLQLHITNSLLYCFALSALGRFCFDGGDQEDFLVLISTVSF